MSQAGRPGPQYAETPRPSRRSPATTLAAQLETGDPAATHLSAFSEVLGPLHSRGQPIQAVTIRGRRETTDQLPLVGAGNVDAALSLIAVVAVREAQARSERSRA
jgi:hypothetical protein